MSDGIIAVLAFLEDSSDSEGHQPFRGKREIEGERGRVMQRLRQVLQEGEYAQTT